METTILIVDDHGIVRQGVCQLLGRQPDLTVVGQAADGREAVELARKLQPAIVLMDIVMPNLNGIDATAQILRNLPQTKVIILSGRSHPAYVKQALKVGAKGYVLKGCSADTLLEAVNKVASGQVYLCPKVTNEVVRDYKDLICGAVDSPVDTLTERQREVLQLIAEGKTTKQIALQLHVSTKAIEATRRKIMEKLDTYSVAELVKIAIASGLSALDTPAKPDSR